MIGIEMRVGDGGVVGEQLAAAERVVERRHDHHRSGAAALGVDAELDGLARGERAGAGDDRDAPAGGLDRGLDELPPLGVRERRELAGAAAGHEAADAGGDQAIDDRGERVPSTASPSAVNGVMSAGRTPWKSGMFDSVGCGSG